MTAITTPAGADEAISLELPKWSGVTTPAGADEARARLCAALETLGFELGLSDADMARLLAEELELRVRAAGYGACGHLAAVRGGGE